MDQVRAEKGRRNTLLIDAGDTIQGTQLSYYYAKVDPITAKGGPVASDGAGDERDRVRRGGAGQPRVQLRHRELRKFEEQCDFPLLGANALDAKTLKPAFPPYFIKKFYVQGAPT